VLSNGEDNYDKIRSWEKPFFFIKFLSALPAHALSGLGQSSIVHPTPSSPPVIACGDIEVCCGWYSYTLANQACVLWKKATLLALIHAIKNLNKTDESMINDPQSEELILAFSSLQPFIEANLGWYKMTRHVKSNTIQLWLSSLPAVEDQNLINTQLISFNSGYANLVLDGVYKKCKSIGGRRYTGALNGSQLTLFKPIDSGKIPAYPESTDFPFPLETKIENGNSFPVSQKTLLASQTSRTFGTLSLNVVIPSSN
jgi:hypothetical protein